MVRSSVQGPRAALELPLPRRSLRCPLTGSLGDWLTRMSSDFSSRISLLILASEV